MAKVPTKPVTRVRFSGGWENLLAPKPSLAMSRDLVLHVCLHFIECPPGSTLALLPSIWGGKRGAGKVLVGNTGTIPDIDTNAWLVTGDANGMHQ